MKTNLRLTVLLCFTFYLSSSQVPQGLNYQAIARDGSGNPIINTPLPVTITIQSDSLGGIIFWKEQHPIVSTNAYGLFSLIIGKGVRDPISNALTFNDINWIVTPKFIKTEIFYQSTLKNMGSSRFWTVPYSMVAGELGGSLDKLEVAGKTTSLEEALFEVKNKDGRTVFAVYNEGVRIYVDDGDPGKGPRGGFVIGGFDKTKGIHQDYFIVNSDSIRAYINNDTIKAAKGGFVIGGFNPGKAEREEFLRVTRDSTRVYLNDTGTKSAKGGFVIGGFDHAKGGIQDFLNISKDSIRMYIDDKTTKTPKGGFAIGGFDIAKGGGNSSFFDVATDATKTIFPSQKRILWYPIKNAFLTGKIMIEKPDSVGENSFASGYESKAIGDWSQALGYKSIARGDYSTAIGKEAVADTNSFSFGNKARALRDGSYAFGSGAYALGDKSFAFGSVGIDSMGNVTGNTKATGDHAYSFGLGSVASGRGSFAIGANDTASMDFATAIGYKTKANNWYALAMGAYSQASGRYATAIGYRNKAIADGSTAMGRFSEATGTSSFASGYQSKATQSNATAMGYKSQATASGAVAAGYQNTASQTGSAAFGRQTVSAGAYSMAFGYLTNAASSYSMAGGNNSRATGQYAFTFGKDGLASSDYAFALGNWVKASAISSTATGYHTRASGQYSFAAGFETTSRAFESFVVGRWNDSTGAANMTTAWNNTDPLFIVGNGIASTSPNNAFTVYKSGDTKIDGNVYPKTDNTRSLGLSGNRWSIVYAATGTINTSDVRQKRDIFTLNYGLNEILQLHPVSFKWKDFPDRGNNLGLIAQEVQPIINEVVDIGNDPDKTLGINYSALIPVLIKSIQEQQNIINEQKLKNQELEKQIIEINKKLEHIEKNLK